MLGKGFVLLTLRLKPHKFDSSFQDLGIARMVGEMEICEVKSSGLEGGGGRPGHTRSCSAKKKGNFIFDIQRTVYHDIYLLHGAESFLRS